MYQKVKDGVFYHDHFGRLMEHRGYSTRIFWNKDMLDYLKRNFSTTLNQDLAGCLGVSQSTLIRKARELGLEKNEKWLHAIYDERRILGQSIAKRYGNSGQFKKGVHSNPDTEFKPGHVLTDEQRKKQSESMKKWYRLHPDKVRAKNIKAAETRRKNKEKIYAKI